MEVTASPNAAIAFIQKSHSLSDQEALSAAILLI